MIVLSEEEDKKARHKFLDGIFYVLKDLREECLQLNINDFSALELSEFETRLHSVLMRMKRK